VCEELFKRWGIDEEVGVTNKMDDYMFKTYVGRCRNVTEITTYLEIFTYSVSMRFGISDGG
jgi:hypothetical protein